MNLNLYYDKVGRLEKEISDLQKRIADETKKELDKQKQIDSNNRSAASSTSLSTLKSKQHQNQGYQGDIIRIQSNKADLHKKVADKTRELAKVKQDLQKEEIKEKDKLKREQEIFRKQQEDFQRNQLRFQQEQERLQQKLQSDISSQKEILNVLVHQIHSTNADREVIEQKEYDFFISHATEDKESFVRPLAELLTNNGYKIWYDEFQMKIGDSLRKKIDEGLKFSKYGIAVLSRDFFRKNWTEYELNGLVAREMNGIKVILPIWHNVTRDEVLSFSPTLADKVALNTAIYSLQEIANELGKLIEK
ncbi:toll/interleukin-1 receptor domain-containing protein [Bacteroides ihuae]|uniref:toll/interleukin-1 receptor domain-containing protein n=1 Tax=Bacteroides ihuae TaxID=1852362 RepID=UPI0008D9EB2D|nr:toll/interleukin-1 receptor domain-containing protein [Bacteroides ihuae]